MMGYTGKALATYIHDELTAFKRKKHEFKIRQLEVASQERMRQVESGDRLALERMKLESQEHLERDKS